MKKLSRDDMKSLIGGVAPPTQSCTADCGVNSQGKPVSVTCEGGTGTCEAIDNFGCWYGNGGPIDYCPDNSL
jgi:hypothetical protein